MPKLEVRWCLIVVVGALEDCKLDAFSLAQIKKKFPRGGGRNSLSKGGLGN